MRPLDEARERLGAFMHRIHGSRGLFWGALGLLILTTAQPSLPRNWDVLMLTAPVFLLFVGGLITLPREGVAAIARAETLTDRADAWKPMAKRLFWPLLLSILMLPPVFLFFYGIPHMSPFAALIDPDLMRQITLTFLFFTLLMPALYLRSSRKYAPDIRSVRPKDIAKDDVRHGQRDNLLWLGLVLLVAWAWLLRPFWHPFSLADWPPDLDSLRAGPRGVGSFAFAIAIPLTLWMSLTAHLSLLRKIWHENTWKAHRVLAILAGLHVVIIISAIVLHAYVLLWIAQYRSATGF